MTDKTLWAVNIQGPDDMIAVKDYESAIKVANAFNDWWKRHVHVKGHDDNLDPRMWAVPVDWNGNPEDHAQWVATPSVEYKGFIDFAETQV